MNKNDIQKQLAKLRRNKRILWLGIMFFVLVILWILTSIFTVARTSSISQELRDLAKSFVPRLESKVFDEIISKRAFSEEELSLFPVYTFDKNNVDGSLILVDITAPKENISEVDRFLENSLTTESNQPSLESSSSSQATESTTQSEKQIVEPTENVAE